MQWFDYGVDAPPKWQLVSHLVFAIVAIVLGYLYWGIGGAVGGYLTERVASKIIWWPYRDAISEEE